jgi:hypothetical protein
VRTLGLVSAFLICASSGIPQSAPASPYDRIKALAGEWEAQLAGFGKISDAIRLVSNGKAIEETIGTPADNEVSLYTREGDRVLMTHYCALTPDGNQPRFKTRPVAADRSSFEFEFVDATNLPDNAARHMRLVTMTLIDRRHFTEKWTMVENGKDTILELKFARR